jgi:hypothetical protein
MQSPFYLLHPLHPRGKLLFSFLHKALLPQQRLMQEKKSDAAPFGKTWCKKKKGCMEIFRFIACRGGDAKSYA